MCYYRRIAIEAAPQALASPSLGLAKIYTTCMFPVIYLFCGEDEGGI